MFSLVHVHFTFQPLGAADYLEICKNFDLLLLRGIPHMDVDRKVEARRFITLVDTLYDHSVRLVCSAEVGPDQIFATACGPTEYDKFQSRVLRADLNMDEVSSAVALCHTMLRPQKPRFLPGSCLLFQTEESQNVSLFTGEEEIFAFDRVVSRLVEMQSTSYWQRRPTKKDKKSAYIKKRKKITNPGDAKP